MKNSFILDACAVIAFLNAEEGGEKVKDLLENKDNNVYLHHINLCEVYYGYYKADGIKRAEKVLNDLEQLPIRYIEDMSIEFLKIVGKYKASYQISLADAFVIGLAETLKGKVVTTDHKEFDPIDNAKLVKFFWLR
ncbi:MAG: type II toxin-antitoxin system VapC family toxin [bacterium]